MASKKSNPYLKVANQLDEYTDDLQEELFRCQDDVIYCVRNYFKIQHPTLGTVPFDLHPYQEELLRLATNHPFVITLFPRQSGKTTTIGAFLLYYAMFNDDKTVLIVSNKGDNAKEIIERIKFMYENLPSWLKPGIMDDGWNKHTIKFDNKSRIISQATSENSGRGLSVSLLFCVGGENTVEVMLDDGEVVHLTMEQLYELTA